MNNRSPWLRRAVLVAILLIPSAVAWSDAGLTSRSAENKKTCYCGCDMKAGAPMCTHMCELPKYANRSWATTCNRKANSPTPASPAQSNTHSRKNNRVQDARR